VVGPPAPGRGLQDHPQLGEGGQGFGRQRVDLVLGRTVGLTVYTSCAYKRASVTATGISPVQIRAALHPEYRDEFDRDYRLYAAERGSRPLIGVAWIVSQSTPQCSSRRSR
jgi:hypothetical protein